MNKLIIAITISTPAAAFAGGYLIPNETARELATSEAGVAAQDGAEAILLNVAALAGQQDLNVSLNGELLVNQTDWTDPSMGSSSLVTVPTYPPAGAVSYGDTLPNGMGWGLGAGMSVAGGASLKWPNGWPGQEAAQNVEQQAFEIGLGGAIQPLPYLKLGAAYLRYHVVEELHQSINYLDHYGDAGVALSGGGNGFELGAEFKVPTIPLAFGANYKHSVDVALEGDAHFTAVPTSFQPMIHDQGVTQNMTIPNILIVGAAYDVIPNLKLMAAYTLERWSVYKNDTLVGSDGFMVVVPRNYNNASVYRLGAEWQRTPFWNPLTLRAGALLNVSPQPTDTISPTLTDSDALGLSIGAGYHASNRLRFDIGYQHFFMATVKASGDAFPGSYSSSADMVSLGLNWRTDLGFIRSR
ncbi:MAG TPA: outer membrane protein transport protein [Kofleriaceae bacterium]